MTATPTAEFASLVYGPDGVTYDDPAETFHEASSLYPDVAPGRLLSLLELERNVALQETVTRASYTRDHLAGIDLPAFDLGGARLHDVLVERRSRTPEARAGVRFRRVAPSIRSSCTQSRSTSIRSNGAFTTTTRIATGLR